MHTPSHTGSRTPAWLIVLCASRLLLSVIFNAYAGVMPLVRAAWGMSAAKAATIQSAWHLGCLASLFAVGMLADRYGARRIDNAACAAIAAREGAESVAQEHGREEAPGLFVVRLAGRRAGRTRKAMLRWAEERAPVGVVVETDGRNLWVTAATFDQRIDLSAIELLDGGHSDYRYAEPKPGGLEPILQALARAVRES